jgi:SAM-dependent methyltransferase
MILNRRAIFKAVIHEPMAHPETHENCRGGRKAARKSKLCDPGARPGAPTIAAIFGTVLIVAAALSVGANPSGQSAQYMRTPDVVYVGTPYDVVSRMLQMAKIKTDDVVYDLGCGDARILILAAQKYGCRAIGYDIDPEQVRLSRENVAKHHVEDLVKIVQADIFTLDLREADVIPMYLLPEMNQKLLPQLEKLKPGSRLVCHNYDMDGFVPDETVDMISNEDNAEHQLYLYTLPLKKR